MPELPTEQVARGYLMTQGRWSANEAERILSGPAGESGQALILRQILRTYASLSEPERQEFRSLVKQNEEGFEVSRTALLPVPIGDIRDVRAVEGLPYRSGGQLLADYAALPLPERQRMLRWITTQEALAFSEQEDG